jgi:collagenase-like PrtC family protease
MQALRIPQMQKVPTDAAPVAGKKLRLSLGPILFFWSAERVADFYAGIADEAPLDLVYLGEIVCSKREPFLRDRMPAIADRLRRGGKEVCFSTLQLITANREREMIARQVRASPTPVEINDPAALAYLDAAQRFRGGPFLNVYHESTVDVLVRLNAISLCFPPDLSIDEASLLARHAGRSGVESEMWAFGRIPLGNSSRCYRARLEGLGRENCQFVCGREPDGLTVEAVDGGGFVTINGTQTMSHSYRNLAGRIEAIAGTELSFLRLSPQDCDMAAVAKIFSDRVEGHIEGPAAMARLTAICAPVPFSNGLAFGGPAF